MISSSITDLIVEHPYVRVQSTLPETNIEPENRPSQKERGLPTIKFKEL